MSVFWPSLCEHLIARLSSLQTTPSPLKQLSEIGKLKYQFKNHKTFNIWNVIKQVDDPHNIPGTSHMKS